jgi:hypothetical protein
MGEESVAHRIAHQLTHSELDMSTINRIGIRLLSNQQLEDQQSKRRTLVWRISLAVGCALLGSIFFFMTALPLLANETEPLRWVYEANQYGLTDTLRDNGLRLLANGRIEVVPSWISWVFGAIGTLFLWLASILFVHRNANCWHGSVMSLGYWTTFYLLRKENITHHVVRASPKAKSTTPRAMPKAMPKVQAHS